MSDISGGDHPPSRSGWLLQLAWLVVMSSMALVVCEFGFRSFIFSDSKWARVFQNPALYFNYYSDERYWSFNFFTDFKINKIREPMTDPLLGWPHPNSNLIFDSKNFQHLEFKKLGGRRPVLMYGDSFGHCETKICFQDYFNSNPEFSKKSFFLNYSVQGYGLDQIYLLMNKSLSTYQRPFVIIGIYPYDIDRTNLPIFIEQKPYFEIENEELKLMGVPIEPIPYLFFEKHWPNVFSYLWRLLDRKIFPQDIYQAQPQSIPKLKNLTRLLLRKTILELRQADADFMFVIFTQNTGGPESFKEPDANDWRLETITSILAQESAEYLVSKHILRDQLSPVDLTPEKLTISDKNIHPNDLQNKIIYEGILRLVLPKLGGS